MSKDAEARLTHQITKLADRIRDMRTRGAKMDAQAIRALEAESRSKWEELRALRAGGVSIESLPKYGRGSRQ